MKKLFITMCSLFGTFSFLAAQESNSTVSYALEAVSNNECVEIEINLFCTAEAYPVSEIIDGKTIRYKVAPNEDKSIWGVYQVQSDGSKKLIQSFYGVSNPSKDYSYVDISTGEIYLYTDEGYTIFNPKDNSIIQTTDGHITSNDGVIFRDINISDLIREESDGAIHIGENSLVTVETDGVQLLYATDANGDQIDINIKAGTDLLVDGKSVTQALTDIDTNKTNIATNTTGIATNKTNIATNTAGIATNTTNIATNTAGIAANTTGIANNVVRLDNLGALAASNANRVEGLETLTGLMQNEYRSGIASSIALSQIQYAASGFSIGVGHGEFKNKDEMAVGIGYGGQFNEDVGFQFQFGSSGDSTGFGFTISF